MPNPVGELPPFHPAALNPKQWSAPRGRRPASGRWPSVWARDPSSLHCHAERAGFLVWRAMLEELSGERLDFQDLKLRQLAERAGLPLSTVAGMEAGSSWPAFPTLALVADALGYRVQLKLVYEPSVHRRPKTPPLGERWLALEAAGDSRQRARLWHDLVVLELAWLRRAAGRDAATVGAQARTTGDTVRDAERSVGSDRWVTLPVLLGWSRVLGATLAVRQRRDAPLRLAWEPAQN